MRVVVWRADLIRLIAGLSWEQATRVAHVLGFDAPVERYHATVQPDVAPPETAMLNIAMPENVPTKPLEFLQTVPNKTSVVPFHRFAEMTFADEPDSEFADLIPKPSGGLTEEDMTSPGRSILATPPSSSLAPWSQLWPVLRAALEDSVPGRDPDVPALVRAIGRGEIVRRIPRVTRRAWSGRASVWVDRSARLVPFWSDQTDICRRLRKACGQSGLDVRVLGDRFQATSLAHRGDLLAGFHPDPLTPVLMLGDLGAYGSTFESMAWLCTARRLRHAGVRITALVLSPLARLAPAIARAWSAVTWERGRSRLAVSLHEEPGFWQERAERLLRLVAPAALVQPGLLRALRRILPAWQADAATEADVWGHPDVRAADTSGLVLHREAAERWRNQFSTGVDADTKAKVSAAIGRWHGELPRELLRAETLVWHALVSGDIAPPGDLNDALDFARRLAETVRGGDGGNPKFVAEVRRYGRTLLSTMPPSVYATVPSLKIVWMASFQDEGNVPVPPGFDLRDIYAVLGRAGKPHFWAVRQIGNRLVFSPLLPSGAWPSQEIGTGSPVAWLLAARPYLWVTLSRDGSRTQILLKRGLSFLLRPGEGMTLRTDCSEAIVRPWRRESWAMAAGRDRFGLWADTEIKGVFQRFRWIPPGRFWMGSPQGEAGRWDDEGPQHIVTWTRGMWLADTPVTQALWEAVMGECMSEYRSPDRPVENVSWDDCKIFLCKLSEIAPKLEARLPTEGEWEHACRAGTETATWLGDLEIRGENDAPLLDSIAWYGGNCGVEFELKQGTNTGSWPKKQHDYPQGGTHPVGRKEPNPLGLYDMLGNVNEWCEDGFGAYSAAPATDPPWPNSGSTRVLRGGSWDAYARRVRAASRFAEAPGNRGARMGCRLARGHGASSEAEIGMRDGLATYDTVRRGKNL